jgi:hypothetical protein
MQRTADKNESPPVETAAENNESTLEGNGPEVTVETLVGKIYKVTLYEGGNTVRALKTKIAEVEGTPPGNQEIFSKDSDGEPLEDDLVLQTAISVTLISNDFGFNKASSGMVLSNGSLTVTQVVEGVQSMASCDVAGEDSFNPDKKYFEVRMDGSWESKKENDPLGLYIGVAIKGFDHTQRIEIPGRPGKYIKPIPGGVYDKGNFGWAEGMEDDTSEWLLGCGEGSLWGQGMGGRQSQHYQDVGFVEGDRLGVLVDMQGEVGGGRVLFFKNGELYGPGFQEGVAGRGELMFTVRMGRIGHKVTLLPDARMPTEPFTKWKKYREMNYTFL